MRTDQIDLQLTNLIALNFDVAKFADSCGDGVRDFVLRHQRIDDRTSAQHGLASVGGQENRALLEGDFPNFLECEVVSVNVQSFHRHGFPIATLKVTRFRASERETYAW